MTVVSIRGHVEGEPYSLTLLDGEIWPGDREPASSKAAALVLCTKGLASPRSVVEYLQTTTDVEFVTPDLVSQVKSAHEAFSAILSKSYASEEPRDDHGRWRALEGAIAGAKIAARALLKVPGVRQDSELDDHLSNAAGAARARDHLGTYRSLRLAQNSLNRMGPAVMSSAVDGGGMPHQHPALLRAGEAVDQAVQAHADLPLTAPALASFSQMKDEMDALEAYEKKAADPHQEFKVWSDAARAAAGRPASEPNPPQ